MITEYNLVLHVAGFVNIVDEYFHMNYTYLLKCLQIEQIREQFTKLIQSVEIMNDD